MNYRGSTDSSHFCLGTRQFGGVMDRQDMYIHPRLWMGSCPFYMYVSVGVHESVVKNSP
jgi:hypothetical protein